jgi:copper oxidase (laccase) domain-containing protein
MKTRLSRRGSAHSGAANAVLRDTGAWTVRSASDLQIVESREMAKLDWLVHGFSTRPGGESLLGGKAALNLGFTDWDERARVAANRAEFVAAITAKQMPLVTLRQIHSDVIHIAAAPAADAPKADALATRTPGLLLGVQTADCVPILLADSRQRVVAAIHAGWRGTVARIAVKALGRMRMACRTDILFSYRREGAKTGRMMAVIAMRGKK